MQTDWQSVARFVIATFRAETVRARAIENVKALVDELYQKSPEFKPMWQEKDVCTPNEGNKTLRHPTVGLITMEYSSFARDGRTD